MIKVAHLDAVGEENAISQPIETVGKNHFALCAHRYSVKFHRRDNLVSDSQIDLALVGGSECVGFPEGHISIIAGKRA